MRTSYSSEPDGDPAGGSLSRLRRPQPQDAVPDPNPATAGGSVAHVRGRAQSLDPGRVPPSQRQRSADAPVRNPDDALAAARVRRHASAERVRGGPGRPCGGYADRVGALRQVSSSPAEGMRVAADAAGAQAPAGGLEQAGLAQPGPGQRSSADAAASALETYVAPGDGAPGRGRTTGSRVACRVVPGSQAGGSARRRAPRTSGERARLLLQTVADVEVCVVAAMQQCSNAAAPTNAAIAGVEACLAAMWHVLHFPHSVSISCCTWPPAKAAEQLQELVATPSYKGLLHRLPKP